MTAPVVGLVVALAKECASLRCRPRRGVVTSLHGRALLVLAGVGMARASRAAERLIQTGTSALVSWGCAGALVADAEPGDLCLPHEIIDPSGLRMGVDAHWRSQVQGVVASRCKVRTGPLVTHDRIVVGPHAKRSVAEAYPEAEALDMESAAVALVAHAHGIPFLAVRAIVDRRDFALPGSVIAASEGTGEVRLAALATGLVQRPGELPQLVHLARAFGAAHRTLALAASLMGEDFLLAASAPPTVA